MGIAIIIPGANYSSNNLGTVTRKQSTAQIVDAYLADTGADSSYRSKLITLYDTLDALNVHDTLDVYPMLGSSLANKLKVFGEAAYFNSLKAGANASSGTVGIDFDNATNPAFSDVSTKTMASMWDDMFVFTCAKRTGTLGQNIIARYRTPFAVDNGAVVFSKYGAVNTSRKILAMTHDGSASMTSEVNCESDFVSLTGYVDGTTIKMITNGVENGTNTFGNAMTNDWVLNNAIGGDCLQPGSNFPDKSSFGGTIKMFAVGYVPTDKVASVDSALRTFLS